METLLRFLHIACGVLALGCGTIAALSAKGMKVHRLAGKIFYIAMYGVVIAATILAVQKSNWFLFSIGIFAFYLTFSGVRVLGMKNIAKLNISWADWLLAVVAILCGFGMVLLASIGMVSDGQIDIRLVLLVFGFATCTIGVHDLQFFVKKVYRKNETWLLKHIVRMGGAFISTITAFAVVNGGRVPVLSEYLWFQLLLWLGPSFIGAMILSSTVKKYIKIKV
jgi:uncharacterized membrane protein